MSRVVRFVKIGEEQGWRVFRLQQGHQMIDACVERHTLLIFQVMSWILAPNRNLRPWPEHDTARFTRQLICHPNRLSGVPPSRLRVVEKEPRLENWVVHWIGHNSVALLVKARHDGVVVRKRLRHKRVDDVLGFDAIFDDEVEIRRRYSLHVVPPKSIERDEYQSRLLELYLVQWRGFLTDWENKKRRQEKPAVQRQKSHSFSDQSVFPENDRTLRSSAVTCAISVCDWERESRVLRAPVSNDHSMSGDLRKKAIFRERSDSSRPVDQYLNTAMWTRVPTRSPLEAAQVENWSESKRDAGGGGRGRKTSFQIHRSFSASITERSGEPVQATMWPICSLRNTVPRPGGVKVPWERGCCERKGVGEGG